MRAALSPIGRYKKLTPETVAMIRLRYHLRAASQVAMAKEYGVCYDTVHFHTRSCKGIGYPLGDAINDACIAWRGNNYADAAAALRRAADLIAPAHSNSNEAAA
jgi:hypothetical protein